jgi:hypothetical protein
VKTGREPIYKVFSPEGGETIIEVVPTAPVGALNRAVIGQVWDYMFRGDEIFQTIRDALEERAPGVRFVGHTVFGNIHGPEQDALTAAIPNRVREHGCTAVVIGVGA